LGWAIVEAWLTPRNVFPYMPNLVVLGQMVRVYLTAIRRNLPEVIGTFRSAELFSVCYIHIYNISIS